MSEILITTLGKLTDLESDQTFIYKGRTYEKVVQWEDFNELLELKKGSGFFLKALIINGQQFLVLFYSNAALNRNIHKQDETYLLRSFFEEISESSFLRQRPVYDWRRATGRLSMTEFYEELRKSHENDDLETGIPAEVQHPALRPELRPYQVRGVRWMLKRETQVDHLPPHYAKLRSKFNPFQFVYFNKFTLELSSEAPSCYRIPSGGMLTDEMGLGKTVEMIGLILMNPRRLKRKFEELEEKVAAKPIKEDRKVKVKCICGSTSAKKKAKMMFCSGCQTQQHQKCVNRSEMPIDDYACPSCWKTSERLVESKTTIIVTPPSILRQWQEEIKKHVSDATFRTLIYSGISKGWISPHELAKYDVIITDFNTLSRELYFCDPTSSDRSFRHGKKFEYPLSPLMSINFWRVVLDEAQMVENKTNRPSQMVKQLSTVHRWATTGTPVEKNSLGNLYGLLFFLNYEPYADEKIFYSLLKEFNAGRYQETIDVLSKVMWRTCKKNVEHEIRIPNQSEIVHLVDMTNLQECFYRQALNVAKPIFQKNVESFLRQYSHSHFLYEINNTSIKAFFEPLRRLRQDCTIPSIFNQSEQRSSKHVLKPEQLHEHLVSKASLEAKSALRTICSSLNGIAAMKLAEGKYNEAINFYNQVLKLSKEHSPNEFVSVDSMLQIHSFNGLLELGEALKVQEILEKSEEYRKEMHKLEWKYISKYYDKVKSINDDKKEHLPEYQKASRECTDKDGEWWQTVITLRRSEDEDIRFMNMINTEIFSVAGGSALINELRTTRGIQLVLTEWSDKIGRFKKDVNERFAKFSYIIDHLRPVNEMPEKDREKLEKLAKAALSCHLNLLENDEENEDVNKKRKKGPVCELCTLKMKLNEFECVLFNKTITDEDDVEGTWNPRLEENLLKGILKYAKNVDFDDEILHAGRLFFAYLKALKTQYKFQAKLWVEVNYTISAFDEINMCKMRMEVVDSPEEMTDEDVKFRLKILRHEISDQILIFQQQKQEAEINFVRLNGRLKYLEHLKEKNEPQACPICTNIPKERYFVTVCGHFLCTECFTILTKNKPRHLNCPVCRTPQSTNSIYTVTCIESQSSGSTQINGSYSPKIDEMIRCILNLKKKDPKVKILVFSHWDLILQAIASGLDANAIAFKSSYHGKFNTQISDFKDRKQDITCMLLNLKFGGKGLNLIEATHVFLVEPILNADEELQAVGRVHRIGQTKETFVHRFVTKNTIEHTIYEKITSEPQKWMRKEFTIKDIEDFLDGSAHVENEDDSFDL